MKARFGFAVLLFLLTAGAFAFRLPSLDNRPMHADEAVHALKFRELWEKGVYRYDPNEFHGPTLYYAALPIVKVLRRRDFAATQEGDYRLVTVLFGAGLLPLFALFADGIGKRAALTAALLTGISPAFVFYSRYYIQEVLLAFFTLGAIACVWRYRRSLHFGWAIAAGLCAGLMLATKETAVLSFAAGFLSFGLTKLTKRRDGRGTERAALINIPRRGTERASLDGVPPSVLPDAQCKRRNGKHAAIFAGAAAVTSVLFLSGFGSNWRGPLDYFRAYTPWLRRAGETEMHRHGFGYYIEILCWHHAPGGAVYSEGLIVALAIIGIAAGFVKSGKFAANCPGLVRFITFYTLILTGIYSAIPYKTPWCVLSFLTGMILLAGIGADFLLRLVPGKALKIVLAVLLATSAAQLGNQAERASFTAFADPKNPYVYAQTVPDILNLYQKVNDFAQASPQHNATIIKVISTDGYYWPLPWYLRRFDADSAGYYTNIPANADAPIVIAASEMDEELTKRLGATHIMTGYTGLRPGVTYETFVRMDLWKSYLDWKKANGKDNDE